MSSLYVATEIGAVRLVRKETSWASWHKECVAAGRDCDADPCTHPAFQMGVMLVEAKVAQWVDWLSNELGDRAEELWACSRGCLCEVGHRPTIDKMPVIDALDPKNEAVKRTLHDTLRRLGFDGNLDGTL